MELRDLDNVTDLLCPLKHKVHLNIFKILSLSQKRHDVCPHTHKTSVLSNDSTFGDWMVISEPM